MAKAEADPLLQLCKQEDLNWIGVDVPFPSEFVGYRAAEIRRQVGPNARQTVVDGHEVGQGGDLPHLTLLYGFDPQRHPDAVRLVHMAGLRASDIKYSAPYRTYPAHLGGKTMILCADVLVTVKIEKLLKDIYTACGKGSTIPLHLTLGKWEDCLPMTTREEEEAMCVKVFLWGTLLTAVGFIFVIGLGSLAAR